MSAGALSRTSLGELTTPQTLYLVGGGLLIPHLTLGLSDFGLRPLWLRYLAVLHRQFFRHPQCRFSKNKSGCELLSWLTACDRQMDVAILLDLSGSNEQMIFDAVFHFTRMLILGLPVGSDSARVSVVRYSDSANVSFHLDSYNTSQQVTNCRYSPTGSYMR